MSWKIFQKPRLYPRSAGGGRAWGHNVPLKLVSLRKNFFPGKNVGLPLVFSFGVIITEK
jgi:hypothetical protein